MFDNDARIVFVIFSTSSYKNVKLKTKVRYVPRSYTVTVRKIKEDIMSCVVSPKIRGERARHYRYAR